MRVDQRLAHQHLVGDAVVAGDDLVQDAVDVVARQRHDGPGVGERGVAGAADQPGIDQRHARAGRAVALGGQRRQSGRPRRRRRPARRYRSERHRACSCRSSSPRPRPVLHRRMHVDDVLRAEDFAAEAGDAVLAELDDRQELGLPQARNLAHHRLRLHVDDVGRADHVADAATGAFLDFDVFDHAVS